MDLSINSEMNPLYKNNWRVLICTILCYKWITLNKYLETPIDSRVISSLSDLSKGLSEGRFVFICLVFFPKINNPLNYISFTYEKRLYQRGSIRVLYAFEKKKLGGRGRTLIIFSDAIRRSTVGRSTSNILCLSASMHKCSPYLGFLFKSYGINRVSGRRKDVGLSTWSMCR